MMKDRLLSYWYQLSIKRKMYTIVGVVGIVMTIAILLNIRVIYTFVDDEKVLMENNLSNYKFQESLETEVECFSNLIKNHTSQNETLFYDARKVTKDNLYLMPYDYHEIGEERYAITWNIRNGYEEYCEQSRLVLSMQDNQTDYIEQVYKTYQMQQYLKEYASRLTKAAIESSADYYERQIPVLGRMPYTLTIITFLSVIVLILVARAMTGSIINTLSDLAAASKGIEQNDFAEPDVIWNGQDEMGQLVYSFNRMKHATKDYVRAVEEKRNIEEKLFQQEIERANLEQRFSFAQLQLIKSQMNPHFLFNTLNMVTKMSKIEEAPVTEEMLMALSNLLRYSLRTTEPFTPLDQELKVLEDYLYIQKKRFGSRIIWKIDCEVQPERIEIPVFLIQPLAENAVIHGLADKEEGGTIYVRIVQEEEMLQLEVADTGVGIEPDRLEQIRAAMTERGSGLGIGLGNIYRRISAYYERGEVTIDSQKNEGTVVRICFGRRK